MVGKTVGRTSNNAIDLREKKEAKCQSILSMTTSVLIWLPRVGAQRWMTPKQVSNNPVTVNLEQFENINSSAEWAGIPRNDNADCGIFTLYVSLYYLRRWIMSVQMRIIMHYAN